MKKKVGILKLYLDKNSKLWVSLSNLTLIPDKKDKQLYHSKELCTLTLTKDYLDYVLKLNKQSENNKKII